MTVASGGEAKRHVLQRSVMITTEEVSVPERAKGCGFAERTNRERSELSEYMDELRRECKVRYTGAMVADAEQMLSHGGIIGYPATQSRSNGVLRLQFEANPMAHVVESAGGSSSMGAGSILDVHPDRFHRRIPTYLGTPKLIDRLGPAL